jgi:hypothetical protein
MKRLSNYRQYVDVNEMGWKDTSDFNHILYEEERPDRELSFDTFEEAYDAVEKGAVMNAWVDKTFFFKEPCIRFSFAGVVEIPKPITKKNFKSLKTLNVYEDVTNFYSVKDLMSLLTAENFVDWAKDNGLGVDR